MDCNQTKLAKRLHSRTFSFIYPICRILISSADSSTFYCSSRAVIVNATVSLQRHYIVDRFGYKPPWISPISWSHLLFIGPVRDLTFSHSLPAKWLKAVIIMLSMSIYLSLIAGTTIYEYHLAGELKSCRLNLITADIDYRNNRSNS